MVIKEFIREGALVEEVLKFVEKKKIDLIIILTPEEGWLGYLLFSCDNEKHIGAMPCSMYWCIGDI